MLHVACCMSHVACRMSHVACRMSHVACRMSHVACRMSHVACCIAYFAAAAAVFVAFVACRASVLLQIVHAHRFTIFAAFSVEQLSRPSKPPPAAPRDVSGCHCLKTRQQAIKGIGLLDSHLQPHAPLAWSRVQPVIYQVDPLQVHPRPEPTPQSHKANLRNQEGFMQLLPKLSEAERQARIAPAATHGLAF